ncbi:MAG: hypothetical protein R6U84_08420 [Candidatus Cloacimonadales bacterium]
MKFSNLCSLLLLFSALLIGGCYLGSITDFSESDIAGKPNLMYNPDFELGEYEAAGFPQHWVSLDSQPGDIVWDNAVAQQGEKSLRIEAERKINLVSEAFSLDPIGVYYARIYAKSQHKLAQNVRIKFITFDRNGKQLDKFSKTIMVSNEWIPVNITTGFFKSGAVYGRIIISVDSRAGDSIWLDNAGCYKVYEIK